MLVGRTRKKYWPSHVKIEIARKQSGTMNPGALRVHLDGVVATIAGEKIYPPRPSASRKPPHTHNQHKVCGFHLSPIAEPTSVE